jgi:hypothetical protein
MLVRVVGSPGSPTHRLRGLTARLARPLLMGAFASLFVLGATPSAAPAATVLGTWGSVGGANGQFGEPSGIAVNTLGDVYVADQRSDRIQEFRPTGAFVLSWRMAPGPVYPYGVAIGINNDVYVTGRQTNMVYQYDLKGGLIRTWGGGGTGAGRFDRPQGIAVGPNNDVYVVDRGARIQRFDSSGRYITTYPTKVVGGATPTSIAVNSQGEIYVTTGLYVEQYSAGGQFVRHWGTFGSDTRFASALGIATAPAPFNNVLVTEHFTLHGGAPSAVVQDFEPNGRSLGVWEAGTRVLDNPLGIAVSRSFVVYVADSGHQRIVRFSPY